MSRKLTDGEKRAWQLGREVGIAQCRAAVVAAFGSLHGMGAVVAALVDGRPDPARPPDVWPSTNSEAAKRRPLEARKEEGGREEAT